MTTQSSNINKKGFLLVLVLLLGATLATAYKEELNSFAEFILKSKILFAITTIYIATAIIAKNVITHGKNLTSFQPFTETIFSILTYTLSATTSITLISGVYFQHASSEIYFKDLDKLDLGSIAVVASYLLLYSLIIASKMFGDVIFTTKSSTVKAAP